MSSMVPITGQLVGVVGREEQLEQPLAGAPVGLVVDPLAALVHHHLALRLELLRGHARKQEAHAVGLQPEAELEARAPAASRSSWCGRTRSSRWRRRRRSGCRRKCSLVPTCALPWKSMCSNRWAKPVWPGRSFFEPTWYQRLTATSGRDGSRCRTTLSPLSSVWRSIASGAGTSVARDGHGGRVYQRVCPRNPSDANVTCAWFTPEAYFQHEPIRNYLTPRQKEILEFIGDFRRERGYSPDAPRDLRALRLLLLRHRLQAPEAARGEGLPAARLESEARRRADRGAGCGERRRRDPLPRSHRRRQADRGGAGRGDAGGAGSSCCAARRVSTSSCAWSETR